MAFKKAKSTFEDPDKIKVYWKMPQIIVMLLVRYSLSYSSFIKRRDLFNLRRFINLMDMDRYKNDADIFERLLYVKTALRGRMKHGIADKKLLRLYIKEQLGTYVDKSVYKEVRYAEEVDETEIDYVKNYVWTNLRTANIQRNKDDIINILDQFSIGNYEDKNRLMNVFFEKIQSMLSYERQIALKEDYEQEVEIGSKDFPKQLKEIIEAAQNPKKYLYSGSKWLNEMVGGAFEAGRCYMFLGPPKSFKSGLLLTLVLWFRKFNPHIEPNDPNKRPCILYITQENSVQETIERIYAMETGTNYRFKDLEEEEIIEELTNGINFAIKDSNIDLRIMYRPAGSLNTDDLYTIIEDLEDEGKEVICLCHDHLKKMRPRPGMTRTERHLELGSISEDFCSIAKTKNLVFLATAHMNRNSLIAIETMKSAGKTGHIKALRSSDVGESLQMSENCDVSIVTERENYNHEMYAQGFKLLHTRVASPVHEVFYIPFKNAIGRPGNNTIALKDDINNPDMVCSFTAESYASAKMDQKIEESLGRGPVRRDANGKLIGPQPIQQQVVKQQQPPVEPAQVQEPEPEKPYDEYIDAPDIITLDDDINDNNEDPEIIEDLEDVNFEEYPEQEEEEEETINGIEMGTLEGFFLTLGRKEQYIAINSDPENIARFADLLDEDETAALNEIGEKMKKKKKRRKVVEEDDD